MAWSRRTGARMVALACAFMALMSLAQAGLAALDAGEGGRAISAAMGRVWKDAMSDGSMAMDLAGVNQHLRALDPSLAIDPGADPATYLHERWLRPRIAGPAPLRIAMSVLIGLFLAVMAVWAWPTHDPRPWTSGEMTR